jgi:hypothetical protein
MVVRRKNRLSSKLFPRGFQRLFYIFNIEFSTYSWESKILTFGYSLEGCESRRDLSLRAMTDFVYIVLSTSLGPFTL